MSDIQFSHTSVLLYECIEALNIRDGYTYIDCTAGGGGHSLEIAKRLGENSRLICFDRDKNAIKAATERLKDHLDKVTVIGKDGLGSHLIVNNKAKDTEILGFGDGKGSEIDIVLGKNVGDRNNSPLLILNENSQLLDHACMLLS